MATLKAAAYILNAGLILAGLWAYSAIGDEEGLVVGAALIGVAIVNVVTILRVQGGRV